MTLWYCRRDASVGHFSAHIDGFKLKLFCEDFGTLEAFRLCTFEDIQTIE